MSNPETVSLVLVFQNTGEREVQSCRLLVTMDRETEARGLFAALAAREPLTIAASALRFYDDKFTFGGSPAPQYRPVSTFGASS